MSATVPEYAFEQIADTTSVVMLTIPQNVGGVERAIVQAVGGNVRYRLDGVNPTAGQGQVLRADDRVMLELLPGDFAFARFIRDGGSSGATLEVHYRLNRAR